jgi:hypothetical protein
MNEKTPTAPLIARKKFALVCMALPCGACVVVWLFFFGVARPYIGFASFWSLVLSVWLFLAGVWLYQKPCSVFNVVFTILAMLPFLYGVLIGATTMYEILFH